METFYRPTWVEVSLDALRSNIRAFQRALPAGMHIMAVVKADAYGHGAEHVVREAMACGVDYFGVACMDEGLKLRRSGVKAPILVLGYTPPEGIPLAARHDLTLTVFQDELWEALDAMGSGRDEKYGWPGPAESVTAVDVMNVGESAEAFESANAMKGAAVEIAYTIEGANGFKSVNEGQSLHAVHAAESANAVRHLQGMASTEGPRKLKVHIKIDTGMGRLGLQPDDEAIAFVEKALAHPWLDVEGIFTHFACADEADKSYTYEQHRKFDRIVEHFRKRGVEFRYVHTGNSAAGIDCPELSYNMVRLGISLYGLYPSEEVNRERVALEPVMSVKTKMVHIKTLPPGSGISYGIAYRTQGEETIATLPIGYADGYSRLLSGHVQALVRGRRVPVVGRICMDQCMVNVTGIDEPTGDEEVVLLGRQQDEAITAEELASIMGTIHYEIPCMVSHRVPRVYIRGGKRVAVTNPLLR